MTSKYDKQLPTTKILVFAHSPAAAQAHRARLEGRKVHGRLPIAADELKLNSGRHAFVLTRYEASGTPYLEVHATTLEGEAVAKVFDRFDRSLSDEETRLVLEGLRDEVRDQLVRAAYGISLEDFLARGGRIKMPSGSSAEESLTAGFGTAIGFVLTPVEGSLPRGAENGR